MTKEFNEILIVDRNDLAKAASDHRRRWVFRILSKCEVDLVTARSMYPESSDISLNKWSDFLIKSDINIIYNIAAEELVIYRVSDHSVLGSWHEPRPVRSKAHRPDQNVLLFTYSEPD